MSVEVEALELLVRVAPIAVAAIADALDQGKSEADALAAARAHLPPRIDTRTEDLERRARVRMSHDVGGTSTPGSQAYALARLHGAGVAPWWALPEHVRIGWEHVAEHLQLPVAERTDEPTAKIGPAR